MDIVGFLKSQFICHLLICYIFIVSGLIINFIQLLTLILWPINKQLFRRINCRLAYCISSRHYCFLLDLCEEMSALLKCPVLLTCFALLYWDTCLTQDAEERMPLIWLSIMFH
uniref:Uncharacterized protein n=1 Tax=Accipiter nisus TaxID=211598 RepID=A0A8B9S137_9AVES